MKRFKVMASPQTGNKSLQEAVELAADTGVLLVPADAAFLCVQGGKIEVKPDER
jgi:hypothetical protein